MIATKEAGPPSYQQPAEITPNREQNSFLRFIGENRDSLNNHSSLTYELRDMEEGWRRSPAVDHFVDENMRLEFSVISPVDTNRQVRRAIDREIDKVRRRVIQVIFSNQAQANDIYGKYKSLVFSLHVAPEVKKSVQALGEEMDEFRRSFQEEKKSVTEPLRESKIELLKKFRDFLLLDPSGIFMFQEFLLNKESGGAREEIRPFLSSLAEEEERMHKNGEDNSLSQAVKEWRNIFKEHPTGIFVDEFVVSIKDPNILEWLRFADTTTKEDISGFLKSRPVATWPFQLRQFFNSFIDSKYQSTHEAIKRELGNFKPSSPPKTLAQSHIPSLEKSAKKRHTAVNNKTTGGENNGKKETVKREMHPIGVLKRELGKYSAVRHIADSELADMVKGQADILDSGDLRMQDDLRNILSNLRENPYGFGTKKLNDQHIVIGFRKFPLRSLNPGKRVDLELSHPQSARTRIVYAIYRNGDGLSTVVLEGVYKHEDYDRKFG